MRAEINQTLDLIDAMLEPDATARGAASFAQIRESIEVVQDAYIEVIQQSLRLLMMNRMEDCHNLLQVQRDQLNTTFERIGNLIEDISDSDQALLKIIVEYLFTRARLVDELKMFPQFGIELLERLTLDESIEATVDYMEAVMTGKKNLYPRVINALTSIT